MSAKIKAFGITREIVGGRELSLARVEGSTVGAFRERLLGEYPRLSALRSLLIAVNGEYAEDHQILTDGDEIALIPPVSGG
jgi:molybdopterin synthase sulfur carrier subunit